MLEIAKRYRYLLTSIPQLRNNKYSAGFLPMARSQKANMHGAKALVSLLLVFPLCRTIHMFPRKCHKVSDYERKLKLQQ